MIRRNPTTVSDHIDTILERRALRIQRGVQIFPPDFIHGCATLDELHERFGAWAEEAVFVRSLYKDGALVAISVARFDDWFLTIEHVSRGEVPCLDAWLRSKTADCATVIELAPTGRSVEFDQAHWVVMDCDAERLRQLEKQVLKVTRDIETSAEDWQQTAQTDLLSLVCLCARLG